jgi:tetratricopeptide (TPR) repeat protein
VAAGELRAQQNPPRDMWPQAAVAAKDGDLTTASTAMADLLKAGRSYGIKRYPTFASAAASLARSAEKEGQPDVAKWADEATGRLDATSPAVAFSNADRAAARSDWPTAIRLALAGYGRVVTNYRTNVLSRADFIVLAAFALAVTTIVLAIALFIRYGRSMAHDFREMLASRFRGGAVSVLAFALLFLPLFLWLGPMWLIFYWLAIFFGYANVTERVLIVVLCVLIALAPLALDAAANWIAGVESTVVMGAISSTEQSYQPEALRRMQELVNAVPDDPMLQVLLGNLQTFEGAEEQAAVHYRRAIELNPNYAGAHVNLGNLHFLNNEFQAAINEYEIAQRIEPDLAIAFYNNSVASGETYKFDQQAAMLEAARKADRSYVERLTSNQPPSGAPKVVMYHPPVAQAWATQRELAKRPAARALFGNYTSFDPLQSALNPITIGALLAPILGLLLWMIRRRTGFAGACIKCGRTFCPRCKSARESATYCTQCIHIYLKRDGVSLETKRNKLEEVSDHHVGMTRRNRAFATFLPGSAQMLEGRTTKGVIGVFLFAIFVAVAIFVGRLAPALGPSADVAQLLVRIAAIVIAIIIWVVLSLPVYRRKGAVA